MDEREKVVELMAKGAYWHECKAERPDWASEPEWSKVVIRKKMGAILAALEAAGYAVVPRRHGISHEREPFEGQPTDPRPPS